MSIPTIDDDVDGTLWGPLAGLRYELNANNDFFVEYQYHICGKVMSATCSMTAMACSSVSFTSSNKM